MILGYREAREIRGTFYEYQYETIVKRTEASKHFKCFQGNNLEVYKLVQRIYCWSDKAFEHVVKEFQDMAKGLLGMYSYRPIGRTAPKPYKAEEVVELIHRRSNFKYTASLIQYGSYDVIQ